MASTIETKYGTSGQPITITLTSLGNSTSFVGVQSTAVDNTANLFLDALVSVQVKTNSSSTSVTGYVLIYAYGTADGGSTWTDTATGTAGAITLTNPPNMKLIGTLNANVNSVTYNSGPLSVASAFGGVLPQKWGIAVINVSGNTLDGTVGAAVYQGVAAQST
jgi:hypothetical protein